MNSQLIKSRIVAKLSLMFAVLFLSSCKDKVENDPDYNKTPAPFNVILISVDTLRADRLNCYGYEEYETSPHIDALARDGVLYENFITGAAWTTPAHLSLFTSLNPSSHGMINSFTEMWNGLRSNRDFFRLPDHRVTLTEVLRDSGYQTAAFTGGGPMDPKLGFNQGFEQYGTSMFKLKENNVGEMFDWIKKQSNNRFFLFWHHFEAHAPYLNTDFLKSVADSKNGENAKEFIDKLKATPYGKTWPKSAWKIRKKQTDMLEREGLFTPEVCDALYAGGVKESDRWTGRLVEMLKKSGLYENTLIVFMSDHGEELADHSKKAFYNKHGHSTYEEMIHVPLIIKLPKQYRGGTRVEGLARTIDVMPTVLDILNISPKKNEMQGVVLKPHRKKSAWRLAKEAFTECSSSKREKKSIRTKRYKYTFTIPKEEVIKNGRNIIPPKVHKPRLYDLAEDPKEKRDLIRRYKTDKVKKLVRDFDSRIRQHISRQKGSAVPVQLDEETTEQLKGLGYIE